MPVSKRNIIFHYLLFFISPVMGLIYGIRSRSINYTRWSIFLFVLLYGALFHPSHLGDGAVHYENVHRHYINLPFSKFWSELLAILSFSPINGTNDDPYIHILSYLIGSLFNVPNLFFFGVAFVFAYFYSGAIVRLLSYVKWGSQYNKFYFIFFLFLFMFWQSPADMQTVRNSTALWVLVYSIISYYQTKKPKYLFLILLPPLIHIGFFALAFPFWVVFFTGYRNPKIYFIIFMVSVLSSNLVTPAAVNEFASQTAVGESKAKSYYRDAETEQKLAERKAKSGSNARFYKVYQSKRTHYVVLSGLIIFMFFFLRQRGFGRIENTLFSYGLAGASFGNFLNFNFAIYNRTWQIAGVFILALFVRFLSINNLLDIPLSFLKVRLPLFIFTLGFVPYVLYLFSAFLDHTSTYVLFMPVIMIIDFSMGISIRGVIGFFM